MTIDGYEMTEEEWLAWQGQPEYIPCCTDPACEECDGENMKANPEHPDNQS